MRRIAACNSSAVQKRPDSSASSDPQPQIFRCSFTSAMNLYTPGKGLFDTHVTWEDIEEDMQRELDTIASFGPNKAAKNIGDGKGFLSRTVLIDPDWQHKDKALPERFVVKILTQLALQTLTKQVVEPNGTENFFAREDFMATFEPKQKLVSPTFLKITKQTNTLKVSASTSG
ncbi:hypothetical protein OESDEN_20137 [Oesophagostomum dentatum]|uniref:Uncharacterized protein n=1 Tax=Oesophagostomum dentatum TaxID=61180 RepID=A0A0B1S4D5_OESDE|nr:hypothetical protein OESDEN_20137 [Oesophagostomum dentatum]